MLWCTSVGLLGLAARSCHRGLSSSGSSSMTRSLDLLRSRVSGVVEFSAWPTYSTEGSHAHESEFAESTGHTANHWPRLPRRSPWIARPSPQPLHGGPGGWRVAPAASGSRRWATRKGSPVWPTVIWQGLKHTVLCRGLTSSLLHRAVSSASSLARRASMSSSAWQGSFSTMTRNLTHTTVSVVLHATKGQTAFAVALWLANGDSVLRALR